jgi:hypothetical protein
MQRAASSPDTPASDDNLRRIQVVAVISVVAMLFIAFRIALLRGFDHMIGIEAWGRMLFAFGGAITDQTFGIGGYVTGGYVEQVLISNGLTADPAVLAKLGTSFPDNLRNPVLIQNAINQAAGFAHGPGPLRGATGDDPGLVDYVKLSFALFGRTLLGLFLTYFILLAIEAVVFLAAFRNRPSCLALLSVVLIAHACVIDSSVFDDFQLGTVSSPRFLSLLAVIPALHAAMLVVQREPASPGSVLLVVLQALFAALTIWIRASAAWVILALLALGIGLLVHALVGKLDWRSRLARIWPVAVFLIVIVGHGGWVRLTLNPVYKQQGDLSHHMFWHAILYSMQLNPYLVQRFGPLFDGVTGDPMTWAASRVYLERHPSAAEPGDYIDNHLTTAAVEKYSRAVFVEMVREDPVFVAETFFYHKPRSVLLELAQPVGSLRGLSWLVTGAGTLTTLVLAGLMAARRGERRQLALAAGAPSVGLVVLTGSAFLTLPMVADELLMLLTVLGAWMMWAVALLAVLGRRLVIMRAVAREAQY